MTASSLNIAIVGFGWMGKTHAYAYRSLPLLYRTLPVRPRLVAVAVRRQEAVDEAVATGGFEYGTTDYQRLLDDPAIDAVHVCTPNRLHLEQVTAALRAGKHVYCDKPLAISAAEAEQMAGACRPGLVNMVATQCRFYPSTMKAQQMVEEGRLGRLLSFRCCYLHASLVDADKPVSWRQRPEEAGGAINDLGSHLLDLLTWLTGPMASVSAAVHTATPRRPGPDGRMTDITVEDMVAMLLRTPDGAIGTAEMSKLATGVNDELRIELHGDRGAIRLNLADPNGVEWFDQATPDQPLGGERGFRRIQTIGNYPPPYGNMLPGKLGVGWVSAHIAAVHHFLCAVAGEVPAHPTFADHARLHRLLDAVQQSAACGHWVNVEATP